MSHERDPVLSRGSFYVMFVVISRSMTSNLTELAKAMKNGAHQCRMGRVINLSIVWIITFCFLHRTVIGCVSFNTAILTEVPHFQKAVERSNPFVVWTRNLAILPNPMSRLFQLSWREPSRVQLYQIASSSSGEGYANPIVERCQGGRDWWVPVISARKRHLSKIPGLVWLSRIAKFERLLDDGHQVVIRLVIQLFRTDPCGFEQNGVRCQYVLHNMFFRTKIQTFIV